MSDNVRRVVREGYDALAARYLEWTAATVDEARAEFVAALEARLPDGAAVLDLGSGAGIPTARDLARRLRVTGIDLSPAQVDQARENVPAGTFLTGDLATVDWPAESFDAVMALYSITHLPRREHAALFRRIHGWLRPGGWFLACMGADDAPDWTGDWLGVEMFFSSWDAATNRRLVRDAGMDLVLDELRVTREPEGDVRFLWILARRPESSGAAATRPP
ncbi:MAG TPA: class I SAM-dependent methyltransferase [Vitreimonas sp.]|jgi:SAM-dependent methyltransferase|nr:class I SAM-dependent methyltransferase [Vitreimonas sp.]